MADEKLRGIQRPEHGAGLFESVAFLVRSILAGINTATAVKVIACTNSGGLAEVGFVDVQPLVNLLDGDDVAMEHGTIYRCPYMRMQGGSNAVIIDPKPGDLGVVVFADRDISSVVANKARANPGSARRFNWADAIYLGGILNGVPTQYVRFADAGVTIHSPAKVTISAPDVQIDCTTFELNATGSATITTPTLTVNGNVTATGTVTAPVVSGTTSVIRAGTPL